MTRALRDAFLAGVLVILPLAVSLWAFIGVLAAVDGFLDLLPPGIHPEHLIGHKIPGLGILITGTLVLLVGAVMRLYTARRVVEIYESLLLRVPLLSPVYQGLKQLITTLMVEQGGQFRQVAMIEYPRREIWGLCFVTSEVDFLVGDAGAEPLPDLVSLFIPTTPNPTSGFYLMVPRADVHYVDLTVEEAFKLIMSGGIVKPEDPRLLRSEPFSDPALMTGEH